MEDSLRVLGFDPGSQVAGYGLLDAAPGQPPRCVTYGALRLTVDGHGRKTPIPRRLQVLADALDEIVETHRPQVFAVEKIFRGKSFESVVRVGEARGVALLVAARHGLEVEEYPPAVVKKTVTGNGQAAKTQVQTMIARLLGLDEVPEPADATDALALAFCYAQRLWRHRLPGREKTALAAALEEARARRKSGRRGASILERIQEKQR